MKKIITSIPNLLLSVLLCFVLSSCSSTGVKMSDSSPWKTIQFEDQANALDVDFIDDKNEYIFSNYLHVNVSPAAAVDFQHFKDKITEKINSYFGYKAIKGIKIHQNFIPKLDDDPTIKKKPKNTKKLNEEVKKSVQGIRDKDLEESVVKLGLSISTEDE